MTAPTWSRLLHRLSRALSAVDAVQQSVRDELLLAFVRPSERSSLTFDVYARNREYVPGGGVFAKGLFPWESALLNDPRIPRSGRVLLAAVGGGRELHALLERGYEVWGFEPVAQLLESARDIADGSNAQLAKGTYQDLVDRAHGRSGPLDGLQGAFDFCILGWGSLSHLTERGAVLDVLRALRALAPEAPVVTSFLLRASVEPTVGGSRKLRRVLRRAFEAIGGLPVASGLEFHVGSGFIYSFSREELLALCDEAGYEVAHFSELGYPHALLLPTGSALEAAPER
jgi:hypothetical protein